MAGNVVDGVSVHGWVHAGAVLPGQRAFCVIRLSRSRGSVADARQRLVVGPGGGAQRLAWLSLQVHGHCRVDRTWADEGVVRQRAHDAPADTRRPSMSDDDNDDEDVPGRSPMPV